MALQYFCDNEYGIVRHCARNHGEARETVLYNERQFWTIAGARAVARNSRQTREHAVDKIIVGLKRVVDYNVRVQVRSDGSGVETDGVKMSINPFDEIALEEALRIREAGNANEVIAVSIGSADAQQQLRTGLAMGADRAILVAVDQDLDPLSVARVFQAIAAKENAGLVMLGKQAIDGDNSQVAQMLAALWDRPQATFASGVSIEGDTARVVREVDAGLETIEVDLPAVISVDLRLNEPRYVKLPDIMKAKKKPLDEIALSDLGVEAAPKVRELSYAPPAARQRGIMVDDVAGLVAALKDKGLV
ncbi:MAG: electron transfer flavoprotein subunit beta/FixA family protein [Gammaproteobacteria bacterium]|nr:electron transfer flavoprotein subunit beta/FixA family protein [Gammaproteobacteria bacterium]MBT8105077.1 electron transfer flavoprotein subunit beta/FixA family protein [Gammaproteobacteria bacterium]NNF48635.1 electron transfer flavoprotein subunit beta/FixA family protein [Woeseiaceae bacterium]NNK25091.1 electron transfer flavoprotein subunit beta/FixA family protein [Woeseiaceae bacterium]